MSSLVEYTCPLDVEDGLARAGGEMDFYKELLDLFLEDVPPRMDELRLAATARDPGRVAAAAHGIKGAARGIGAWKAADAAADVEKVDFSNTTARHAALNVLVAAFADVAAEIESELA